MVLSFGPQIEEFALMKTTGSVGTGEFDSAAWSA
jgi:hypothetical protein